MIKQYSLTGLIILFLMAVSCSESTAPEDNLPGSIIQTNVRDSIQIPQPGYLNASSVRAWAEDPNGLKDVDSVYFYSRKPDGSFANNGLPLTMVDNGEPFSLTDPWVNSGDEKKDDGIFTLTILIDASAQLGTYKFTFYMRDKAGELSLPVVDSIKVYE